MTIIALLAVELASFSAATIVSDLFTLPVLNLPKMNSMLLKGRGSAALVAPKSRIGKLARTQ